MIVHRFRGRIWRLIRTGLPGIALGTFLCTRLLSAEPDALISAEFALELPTTIPAPSAQFAPAIASDGTNYLAVWQDNRNNTGLDLYATRITTNGVVLDPSGFAISTAINDQTYPTIAFNGTNYLVAWQDGRNGNQAIYATLVSPDGKVIGTNATAIVNVSNDQRLPSVSSLNGNFLIAWQDGRNGAVNQDIFAAQINGSGLLVETNGFIVSNAANSQSAPAVTTVGTNYLVAWHDFRSGVNLDVYAARVSTAGTVLDTAGIAVSTAANNQWNVSAAGTGDTALITWEDSRNGTDDDVFAARISTSGTVLDANGLPVVQEANQQRRPAIEVLNGDFYVTWQDNRAASGFDLYGATLQTSDGAVSPVGGSLISDAANDQRFPTAASNGNQLLVVWEDIRNGIDTDIYGSRVETVGGIIDASGLIISTVATAQESPAIASNGTVHLVVWRDFRNDPLGDIYGVRVDGSGNVLDDPALAICTAGNYQMLPRIASSGSDFLVVWQDFRNGIHDDIYGCRVANDGTIIDPNGIRISSALGAQRVPDVAGSTNGWLAVWQDRRTSSSDDVYGTRVLPDGTVQDGNGLGIGVQLIDQTAPSVAGLNGNFFVVWQDNRIIETNRVYGNTVSASGQIGTNGGFQLSTKSGHQSAPFIAASTNQFLAVWQHQTNGSSLDIVGTRVSSAGVVQDSAGITINGSLGDQQLPSVTAKGQDFIVAWEDKRNPGSTNIFTSRLSANGSALDPTGVLSSPTGRNQTLPVISNVGSDYLLAYQTRDSGSVRRIRAVQLFSAAVPVISLSPGSVQFIAEGTAVAIDSNASLIDGANANFESGTLTIDLTVNATASDRLGIRNVGSGAGQIGVSGNTVSYEGSLIGFFTGGTSGTTPLLIILNNLATGPSVEALARHITFNNIAESPITQPRTVRFTLNIPSGAGAPSTRTVTVIDAGSVPTIITPPVNQTVSSGTETTLTFGANGSQPLRFQWLLNGQNIVGATNASYVISSMQKANAGAYSVTISNTFGSIVSEVAELTYFNLAMYAGLTIAGTVGTNYRIESAPALGSGTNWTTLTNIVLQTPSYLFIDEQSPGRAQRFYRAVKE